MHVAIFEDAAWATLAPVALSRPIFQLRSGAGTLLDKHLRYTRPTRVTLWVRPGLAEHCRQTLVPTLPIPTTVNTPLDDQPALLLSARALLTAPLEIPAPNTPARDANGELICALVQSPGLNATDILQSFPPWLALRGTALPAPSIRCAHYLWDLLAFNEESLNDDACHLPAPPSPRAGSHHLLEPRHIHCPESVQIQPGVVLDATAGPILIGPNAIVGAHAVIQGPCHIGEGTQIAPHALIRPKCSIGSHCRAAGEISASIFQGFTNKAHEGFLGDSYLGAWVNLGAGTTTSNIKNTYGEIRFPLAGNNVETHRRFLGSLIGDHSKTAIGTRLLTGTYVGYCAMLALSRFPDHFIPSFSFVTDDGTEKYDLEKARQVMQIVYGRRNQKWSEGDDAVLRYVAETAPQAEHS